MQTYFNSFKSLSELEQHAFQTDNKLALAIAKFAEDTIGELEESLNMAEDRVSRLESDNQDLENDNSFLNETILNIRKKSKLLKDQIRELIDEPLL